MTFKTKNAEEVVTEGLRDSMSRAQSREAQVDLLLAIGRDCAQRMKEPHLSVDHGELLYDELGLPK